MLEAFAKVFVQATQPRTTHTAVDAMECSGLSGIDELAAGSGHGAVWARGRCVKIGSGAILGRIYLRGGCPRAVAVASFGLGGSTIGVDAKCGCNARKTPNQKQNYPGSIEPLAKSANEADFFT